MATDPKGLLINRWPRAGYVAQSKREPLFPPISCGYDGRKADDVVAEIPPANPAPVETAEKPCPVLTAQRKAECGCGHAGCPRCDVGEPKPQRVRFEKGDVVRCLDASDRGGTNAAKYMTVGAEYVVDRGSDGFVYFGGTGGWDPDRFELVRRASDAPECPRAKAAGLSAAWKHVDDASYVRIDRRAKVSDTGSPASPDWCVMVGGRCHCSQVSAPDRFMRKPSEAAALADRYLAAQVKP